jgi:hypothetical protein
MIRIALVPASKSLPAWHGTFVRMLPGITRYPRIAFRHMPPDAKAEAIQEAICNACCAYARLVELNKTDLAYPTVLARYAVAQVRGGRKVGCKLNVRDVLSPYCQQRKKILVERLDHFDREEDAWQEVLVEDKHAGPAEVAATRVDFSAWLRFLPRRLRTIATFLARGETTTAAAKRFRLSQGRISQIRQELYLAWHRFQGEEPAVIVA